MKLELKRTKTQPLFVRINIDDHAKIKAIANREDVELNEVARALIHEALKEVE